MFWPAQCCCSPIGIYFALGTEWYAIGALSKLEGAALFIESPQTGGRAVEIQGRRGQLEAEEGKDRGHTVEFWLLLQAAGLSPYILNMHDSPGLATTQLAVAYAVAEVTADLTAEVAAGIAEARGATAMATMEQTRACTTCTIASGMRCSRYPWAEAKLD